MPLKRRSRVPIAIKRAYESPSPADGHRILVDRLWPRGLARAALDIDEWLKDAAPSARLRKSFHGREIGWGEFRTRYLAELKLQRDALRRLTHMARQEKLTLVYGAQDEAHNNAVVLRQYLNMLGSAGAPARTGR